jgi:predicted CopG family antitoxin
MVVDKRIPVSKQRWEELGDMKRAGQTYDELLEELIQKANRFDLAARMDQTRDMDESELIDLEEL